VSHTPAVSVVIPCFNLGDYIEEAIESVLAQTFSSFEIIVVNDGSTDERTNAVLGTLTHPRVTIIHSENGGVGHARNLGIAQARGMFLCALDADDKLQPTYLEKTVAALEADRSLTFASTWLECFGEEQWIWKQYHCGFPHLLAECTVSTAAVVRREAVLAAGGYCTDMPEQGYEDWDLWISIVEQGGRGTIIPEPLLLYRKRVVSMSTTCCHGDAHLALMRDLMTRHAASYNTHLFDTFLLLDQESSDLLRDEYRLAQELARELEPLLNHKQRELERLKAKLLRRTETSAVTSARDEVEAGGLRARIVELEHALEAAALELRRMRQSASWRVTAPLRYVARPLVRTPRA
jgi:hypothetical protein